MSPRLEGRQSGRRPPEYTLTLAEARTVASALDSASALVSSRLAAPCADCRPPQPFPRHRADLAMAREYRQLRTLLPRPDDKWGQ